MTRHLLIRRPGTNDDPVPESFLPAEANLHEALTEHPELLPLEDLGLQSAVVVGKESSLASGYADLVLIDEIGQVCLVEVKKEGNPDTRRVVAQLIDYAGAMWQMEPETFFQTVVAPYLQESASDAPPSMAEFLATAFPSDSEQDDGESGDSTTETLIAALGRTLAQGRFLLVVAAPSIPPGVNRALEYLNAQGLRVCGLEISYFSVPEAVECFVPRLVVHPVGSSSRGPRASQGTSPAPLDREEFLSRLNESAGAFAASLIDRCSELGARVKWGAVGVQIHVQRAGLERQVGWMSSKLVVVRVSPLKGFPAEPFAEANEELAKLPFGQFRKNEDWFNAPWENHSEDTLWRVGDVLLHLCSQLIENISYEDLDLELDFAFERNDYNIWIRSVPALEPFLGKHLQGTLHRQPDGASSEVVLRPLSADAPGWVPVFPDKDARLEVWAPGEYGASYDFRLTGTSV